MPGIRATPPPPLTPEQIAAQKAKDAAAKKSGEERALKMNQDLADKGDAYGLLRMGERYRDGDGVAKNLPKAREYFTKAVAAGSPSAQEELDPCRRPPSSCRAVPEAHLQSMFQIFNGFLKRILGKEQNPAPPLIAGKSEITSPAELLFLSKFKSGATVDGISRPDDWAGVLRTAPAKAVRKFLANGFLQAADLETSVQSGFNGNQLKTLAKERGLPVSGTKKVLAQRLIGRRCRRHDKIARSPAILCLHCGWSGRFGKIRVRERTDKARRGNGKLGCSATWKTS